MPALEHLNYIHAPAERVFLALTTREGLSEVWTRKLTVKAETGFINEFDFDEEEPTRMKILELEENKRIRWECVQPNDEWLGTEVIFELSEQQGTTKILLTHAKWAAHTEYFRWCNYNWAMFLYSLKSYCEAEQGMPYQDRQF